MKKDWYTSKSLWVNVLAVVAIILQGQFGFIMSPTLQVSILAIINLILRAVTKSELQWGKAK